MAIGVGSLSGRSSSAAAGHHVERFLPNAGALDDRDGA